MFPDDLGGRQPHELIHYVEILIFIAASDGTLVREEIAAIESMMGRAMIHPETRVELRGGFTQPVPIEQSLANIDEQLARIALRDSAFVAAIDGAYDSAEIGALKMIAEVANVNDAQLSQLLDWVGDGWNWFKKYKSFLN